MRTLPPISFSRSLLSNDAHFAPAYWELLAAFCGSKPAAASVIAKRLQSHQAISQRPGAR